MGTWPGALDAPPDIVEFVCSDRYLNRPNLYPRQATLLKVIFLQDDLFTDFDYDVIEEWAGGFRAPDEMGESPRYQGFNGIQPDVLDRIKILKAQGYRWFREVVSVIGRRGSKGHLGGIAGSYILWHYLTKGDPQQHYGVDRDKRLSALVFASKREYAKVYQWRDLTNIILGSNCFAPYISRPQAESLTIFAPSDLRKQREREAKGIMSEQDLASFEILPKESTSQAGRGPAAFMQFYDEIAHVVARGPGTSDEDVYEAATPSLDQFKQDGFIYQGSSPWQQTGKFFQSYERALEIDPQTGGPAYPEMLMVQLASWDPYLDWQMTREGEMEARPETVVYDVERDQAQIRRPIYFMPLQGAIQAYDEQMKRLERANPETFAVERRARFAATLDAYLKEQKVRDIFLPWEGRHLEWQSRGVLSQTYVGHADPAKVGDNFAVAIAHAETGSDGMQHVVFDHIHIWQPGDFENFEIDYLYVEDEIFSLLRGFLPSVFDFDQFNSTGLIQNLRRRVHQSTMPKRVTVDERTETRPVNWSEYECLKMAINLGLVHSPYHEQAELELRFLQDLGGRVDHPTSGPVQTKDVADCMRSCVYKLIGDQMSAFLQDSLSGLELSASQPGGNDPFPRSREEDERFSRLSALSRGGQGGRGHSAPRGGRMFSSR